VVVLNIPTGYFSDLFGRKKSLILAGSFLTLGTFIYSLGHNFNQFLVAEILYGMGISLIAGTDSALVYDTLKDLKQEELYKKIIGNALFYGLIAISVASIIGGFIGKINLRWTFYAMLPFTILLVPLSISMHEPKRYKIIFKKEQIYKLLEAIKFIFIKNKKVRWLIVYSGIIVGFNQTALWLYQPYFKLSGLDIAYFGFVFAAFNIVAAISSKYAHKLEEKLGQKYSLIMLVFLLSISYILMSNFVYLFSFSFAFLQQFIRGFYRPVITDYINKITHSNIRATVLSAQDLIGRLFYAVIIPFVGWFADIYSLLQTLTIVGITTIVVGTTILLILHKDRVI
jgi:MFS family permease